jgi:hypothetical protein
MQSAKVFFNIAIIFFLLLGIYFQKTNRVAVGYLSPKYGYTAISSFSLFFFAFVFLATNHDNSGL